MLCLRKREVFKKKSTLNNKTNNYVKKSENNKNLLYFEAPSMKSLFESMQNWQKENQKRFLSMSIQKEGKKFCCIALTNPSEVIICGGGGSSEKAVVSHGGYLNVKTY